jgi:hypothetical protein
MGTLYANQGVCQREATRSTYVLCCPILLLEGPLMATRRYTVSMHQNVSTCYASDLSDREFDLVAPHVAQKAGSGKKRTVDIREVLNAIDSQSIETTEMGGEKGFAPINR